MTGLTELALRAVTQLTAASVPNEALATLRPSRRIGPLTRPAKFVPEGRAWRLGELLVTADGELFSTGRVTRAVVPRDFSANKSPAEDERRELQRAAARGPFAPGDAVNFDYGPATQRAVFERGEQWFVRLADAEVPLGDYLADRVAFAVTPGWD